MECHLRCKYGAVYIKMNSVVAVLCYDTVTYEIPVVKKGACVKFLNDTHQDHQCESFQTLLARMLYG